jgi:ferredoxin-thioredoxin reductase catalytic subunit
MKVILNPNKEIVTKIKEGLERTGGYCPCKLERIEENKCMCEEFRNQIKDPEYEGYCHCMLYLKTKEDEHGNN